MDLASLQWVQPDIEQSLRQAQVSLEAFADDASQGASLRDCADTLHGVRGVLEMLEVYGVSLLFDELEGVIDGLMAGAIRRREDACDVLMQGIVQVPEYLEFIGRGNRDNAILLMPLLNDIRSVRGMSLLSESVLFSPDLHAPLPLRSRPVALAGAEFGNYVRKLRPYFQRGLVGWYRGDDLHGAFELLEAVVLHVEKVVGTSPCARLWWVARAVVQALKADGLDQGVSLKLLLGQVDRQLKRLIDEGEQVCVQEPPPELLKNLLYYVARSRVATRRVEAVREAFALADLLAEEPAESTIGHSLFGPNLETFGSVSVAVKEDLASVKDVLDTFSRKDERDVAELVPVIGLLQQVADTLGLLGLGIPRRSILEQREVLEELIEHHRAPTNDQLMDVAGALLGVDATMDALSEQGVEKTIADEETAAEQDPGDSHLTGIEYLQLVTSVIGEIKTDLAIVKDAIATFLEDPSQRHRLDEVPRRVEQVVGGMRMLYLEPAADLMEHWLAFVDHVLLRAEQAPGSEVLEPLAEGVESLEYYLESVANARADADTRLDDAERRIRALPVVVAPAVEEAPSDGYGPRDSGVFDAADFAPAGTAPVLSVQDEIQALSARIAAASGGAARPESDDERRGEVSDAAGGTQPGQDTVAEFDVDAPQAPDGSGAHALLGSEAETVANVELPASVARSLESARDVLSRMDAEARASADAPPSGTLAAVDGMEPEIVEIFLEEAHEVLDELAETLPRWSANRNDHDALAQVRRSFHTLKGSGRMAGAMAIGDFCWTIENLLNRVIDGVIPASRAVGAMVAEACAAVPQLLDELRGDGPSGVDVTGMAARAEALAEATASRVGEDERAYLHAGDTRIEDPAGHDAEEAEVSTHIGDTVVLGPSGAEILEFPIRREAPPRPALAPVVALFRDESSSHLDHIAALLTGEGAARQLDPTDYVRAVHTIVGGARSAGMDRMAATGSAVEEYLSTLAQTQSPLSEDGVELLLGAVAWLRDCIARLPEGASGDADTGTSLEHRARELTADAIAEHNSRATQTTDHEGMLAERAELRETFVEEAAEIMDLYESVVERWRNFGASAELMADLQRVLHTLKGGARMVRADSIGNLSHEFESVVTAAAEHRLAWSAELFELVEMVHERVADLIDCMVASQAQPAVDDLLQRFSALLATALEQPSPELATANTRAGAAETRVGEAGSATADQAFDFSSALGRGDAEADGSPEAVDPGTDDAVPESGDAPDADVEVTPHAPDLPAAAGRVSAAESDEAALVERGERIQVDAALLDHLVGYAGEISISQSRIELQVGAFRQNLDEMKQTVARLREQLRRLELETESQMIYRHEREGQDADRTEFDPLELDRFTRMQELSRGLAESVGDLSNIQDMLVDLTRESEAILLQQSRTNTDLQHGLMQTRMLPVGRLVPRFRRIVRQTARELGKQARLEVVGDDIRIDRAILNRMMGPLEHILRNAVDHGLESPHERSQGDKRAEGTIRLVVSRDGPEVTLCIEDDGVGASLEAVRSRALQRDLLAPGAQLGDDELLQLVFEPGFSTRGSVTPISGRGVGLDVVQNEVKQLGGSARIESSAGSGTAIIIRLPLTLAINQALMVQVGAEELGLPLSNVDAVVRINSGQAQQLEEQETPLYEHAGLQYPYAYLGGSLGIAEPAYHQERYPVVLIRAGDNRMAVRVDELRGRHEVVVKSVGPMLSAIRWVSGATIMGDGRVVLILDAPTLVRMATALRRPTPVPITQTPEGKGRLVMVVDDSITVRKVTGRFLQRNGMDVVTAKDGLEALAMLQDQVPDVLLLDIEMPRMDGFELATTIRNDSRMAGLPIIMITSRTGQKHNERARQIGIDRYLGKPYHEGELLDSINALLTESRRALV